MAKRKTPGRSQRRSVVQRKGDRLRVYHGKRDFEQTPEPKGARRRPKQRRAFVVQKHDARRLHYDFRLEHDGVLKSWAVPKEPSYDPKERRLAVRTEDHPLEYARFEGEIPEHQYGAGSVVIWDRGEWLPENDPERGLADGKLDFELRGDRLTGRWALVRMQPRPRERNENWLLIKRSDSAARPASARKALPRRKTARATTAARATRATRAVRTASPAASPGVRRAALPERPTPQLATLVSAPPAGAGWLHEPKLDGYRLLCRIDGSRVALLTRRGNDWTDRFASIAAAARDLQCKQALLDGEAVIFDAHGLTDFQRLQDAIPRNDPAIALVAFDLLYLDGYDLRGAPLIERKRLLERLLADAHGAIRFGEHASGDGDAFLREACRLGLEGIVSKRADGTYVGRRTRSWLKIKCLARQELVIVGYTDPAGSRKGFGALLLGVRDAAAAPLRYAGKVGTGFDERTLTALAPRLAALERRTPPVDAASARGLGRGVHWTVPELVAEIGFSEWTADGRLRHPTFHGLREDKPAREIVVERAAPPPTPDAADPPGLAPAPAGAAPVKLTHPDKVLFPDPGITKRELADYWQQVAEHALPYLRDRPLTLVRCPEGYGGQCFFQKHVGVGVPRVVPRITIAEDEDPYAYVDGAPALLALVQIGALELHVWGSRTAHLEQPDVIVFDLDPADDVEWSAVVGAAFELRERLEALGLHAFARLTGGKGLHVVVPVKPGPNWASVKKFTRAIADEMVRDAPKRFTASMSKAKRGGKIFVDYLRNDRGSTAIASYSPRARAGAPIALPLAWDDLDRRARAPQRYFLRDLPALLRERRVDPWADFDAARRSLVG